MWEPRAVTELRLDNKGVADAYVVLPLGAFRREVLHLTGPDVVEKPEIVYLTGQADLLARFRVSDFRDVVKTPYPVVKSAARVFNWIFSVGLRPAGIEREPRQTLRFFLHLRLHRGVYAGKTGQIEVDVVDYLDKKLRKYHCSAHVQAGLGWADIIVDGRFDPLGMPEFMEFLLDVHEAHVTHGDNKHFVFSRMLTMLGFEPGTGEGEPTTPELPNVKPAMFIRARPGRYQEALGYMTELVGQPMASHLLTGRSDVLFLCDEAVPFLFAKQWPLVAPKDARDFSLSPVERIETHILFQDPPERKITDTLVAQLSRKPLEHCHCRDAVDRNTRKDDRELNQRELVPDELSQPIKHVELLFYNVSRDPATCCDVAPAVSAAHFGLTRLYGSLRYQHRRVIEDDVVLENVKKTSTGSVVNEEEQLKFDHDAIEEQHRMFERWYLISERMLRQRTTGSFDELLLQTDRAVVYRGSVQKFLYLADCLMNDFTAKINGESLRPMFATLYDAASHIWSVRETGLIRIPVRHLFSLPDVIPNLWHEVGVHWFYLNLRAAEFGLRISEEDMNVYNDLGDYYADLVVLRHGFLGRFQRFLISLTRAWIDSLAYKGIPTLVVNDKLAQHLARIEFARYNNQYIESSLNPLTVRPPSFDQEEAKFMMRKWHAYLRTSFPRRDPQPGEDVSLIPPGDEEMIIDAAGILKKKVDRLGEVLPRKFSETVSPSTVDPAVASDHARWLQSYEGHIVEFDDMTDLNSLFGELYWAIRHHRLVKNERMPGAFQKMAGLAKSATIEYHRRQLTVQ